MQQFSNYTGYHVPPEMFHVQIKSLAASVLMHGAMSRAHVCIKFSTIQSEM